MTKRLTILLLVVIMLLALCACGKQTISTGDTSTLDGVTLEILTCTMKTEKVEVNDKTNTFFSYEGKISNSGESEIMKVCYDLDVLDKDGNVIHTFSNISKTMRADPLSNGDSCEFSNDVQHVFDGKAKSVRAKLTKVITAEEMPPVHIPEPGEDLAAALDNEHLKNMQSDPPVNVKIYIDHGGDAETAELTDSEDIEKFVDLFSKVTIDQETNEVVTDNYNGITLTFSDGETVSISLNLKNVEFSAYGEYHIFTLSNFDDLWNYMNSAAEYHEN